MQARFSPDRRYRYSLHRYTGLGQSGMVLFVMLNPSLADETLDDATIRRCVRYAKDWGYFHLAVGNLSPLRATDPRVLRLAGPEPSEIHMENVAIVRSMAQSADLVVAAWGVHGEWEQRGEQMLTILRPLVDVHCLGTAQGGSPLHPLRLRADIEPLLLQGKGLPRD